MSYFAENYSRLSYPLALDTDAVGFRYAQVGAVHAVAAHFSLSNEPAVVSLPTGSGKTAILLASAYALRATRVLILTPSRLVREQIAEEVSTLRTLKRITALDEGVIPPSVISNSKRVNSQAEWEEFRDYDVVVSTVHAISPAYKEVPEPPPDLFDLILVDEAHHSAASTWRSALLHFSNAKQLLLTATPYRQDRKEIEARLIYTYDLSRAADDGVFGRINFQPVEDTGSDNSDAAIARAAEARFRADRAAGYDHCLMVRTDSLKRAAELAELYDRITALRLSVIDSSKSLRTAKKVIDHLREGRIDGIICVNMLGEGFDFPQLKIAAIHAPHRSLAVTLQFIGRFARTSGRGLGPATFLAVPSEIELETEKLYDTNAVWQEMVQNLSQSRIAREVRIRETISTFDDIEAVDPRIADFPLHSLEPYFHVKLYRVNGRVGASRDFEFLDDMEVIYSAASDELRTILTITQEVKKPRWTISDKVVDRRHDLHIIYQTQDEKYLFICTTRRTAGLYAAVEEALADVRPKPLSLGVLNGALNDLTDPEFFNVGMRNRASGNSAESYRILAGSGADQVITRSDARLYHRGHLFGRGKEGSATVTIGLSSASKIWSNQSGKLSELIDWCESLSVRIDSGRKPVLNSGLDYLSAGQEVDTLPEGVVAARWDLSTYQNPPLLKHGSNGSEWGTTQLLDYDLTVQSEGEEAGKVVIEGRHASGAVWRVLFDLAGDRFFLADDEETDGLLVVWENDANSLIDYLNEFMPELYTFELGILKGNLYVTPPKLDEEEARFDSRQIEPVDWEACSVDISKEFGEADGDRVSIHSFLSALFADRSYEVVFYDHGSGEIADFITVEKNGEGLLIDFIHCKGASGFKSGHRVGDLYEVTGQVIKSTFWARKDRMLGHVKRRVRGRSGAHTFVRGSLGSLEECLTSTPSSLIRFRVTAVQPGLKRSGLPVRLQAILAAADNYARSGQLEPLRILSSD